ncbi:unnamed protein product [Brassica oleracea]
MPCLNHPEVDVYTHGNYPRKQSLEGKTSGSRGLHILFLIGVR